MGLGYELGGVIQGLLGYTAVLYDVSTCFRCVAYSVCKCNVVPVYTAHLFSVFRRLLGVLQSFLPLEKNIKTMNWKKLKKAFLTALLKFVVGVGVLIGFIGSIYLLLLLCEISVWLSVLAAAVLVVVLLTVVNYK